MDYILIDSYFDDPTEQSVAHGKFIPYGILILHNVLKSHGFSGKMLLENSEYEAFLSENEKSPQAVKMIGITASSWSRFDAIRKIKRCRDCFPGALIVAGGFHFGNCAEDSIRHIPELDIVVRGEGDEVIVDLMNLALGKITINNICGITYRDKSGELVQQGEKLVVEKLPNLSFMDYSYSKEMFKANPLDPVMPIPAMNILAGRGCPYGCIFCSVSRVKHRAYPVKDLIGVIEKINSKYGVSGVKFWDDSLTINDSHVRELCLEINRRKLNIFWFCDSRANINLNLLPLMYSAGCRFISVGLETGSPKIQKIVDKNISNEQVLQFSAKCKEAGIRVSIFLLQCFPDETQHDLEMTVNIARELCVKHGAYACGGGPATILPGTVLETIARDRGVLPKDFSWAKPYDNPKNLEYGQSSYMPVYIDGISPTMFKEANIRMFSNYPVYASGYSLNLFMAKGFKNIFRRDRTWKEKVKYFGIGLRALFYKAKRFISIALPLES